VIGNNVLRRIFVPKRDEVTGGWRKLHDEELNDLYSLPSIIRMIKSRRVRWAGHLARMSRVGTHMLLVGRQKRKRPLGRLRRRILETQNGVVLAGLFCLRIGTSGGLL
jgi:hypothetical protein